MNALKDPPLPLDLSLTSPLYRVSDFWSLIPLQARHYHRLVRKFFNGDWEDLEQAAALELVSYLKANGEPDHLPELDGMGLITRGMVSEFKRCRRQSPGPDYKRSRRAAAAEEGEGETDWKWGLIPDRRQHTPAQIEVLGRFQRACASLAGSPHWDFLYLRRLCGWTPDQVTAYYRTRFVAPAEFSVAEVEAGVAVAEERIRAGVPERLVREVRLLSFAPLPAGFFRHREESEPEHQWTPSRPKWSIDWLYETEETSGR